MSENVEPAPNPPAVFPDMKDKPFSIRVVEEYLSQADTALSKIQESITRLKASLQQRELENVQVNAQRELLLALQKRLLQENSK